MRYVVLATMMLAAVVPANAKYQDSTRKDFLSGCTSSAKGADALMQRKMKAACECGLGNIEKAIPEEEFIHLGEQPDKGVGQIQPLLAPCIISTK